MNQVSEPTSAVSAAVKKQTVEEKLLAGIKTTWQELNLSDRNWKQNGRKFGKWCSDLRKLKKKPGSRKGLGFEAAVKRIGVNYQKARYWADFVDGKHKAEYAGIKSKPKTNDKERADAKPKSFVLTGLSDEQQDAMARMETDPKGLAQFAHKVITSPGADQVRFVVDRCLGRLDNLQDQLDLLADLRGWIDRHCFELQDQIEAGITPGPTVPEELACGWLTPRQPETEAAAGAGA